MVHGKFSDRRHLPTLIALAITVAIWIIAILRFAFA